MNGEKIAIVIRDKGSEASKEIRDAINKGIPLFLKGLDSKENYPMNTEPKEPLQIPILVSFLKGIQKELRTPTGSGDMLADGIEAIIAAHGGKRPEGAFGDLFDLVKSLGLKKTDLDLVGGDSCKATTETIKP